MRRYGFAKPVALFVLLSAAAAWLWAHEGHQPLPTRGATVDPAKGLVWLSADARKGLDIQTVAVKLQALEERIVAPAVVVSPWQNYAFATSRIEGKIAALHVQPGQVVQRGQPLADVDSLELENLQLELLNAVNDVRLSAANLAGAEGKVTLRELEETQAKHQENRNVLEITRRKLVGLGLEEAFLDRLQQDKDTKPLRRLPIRSPIDGEVVHLDVHVGQVIQPTDHLLDVVDLSAVWVQIAVLEKDWLRIEAGQPVTVRLPAGPEAVLRGTVGVKGLALDPQSHQGTVWVHLANPAGPSRRLLPGMFGQAEITLATGKNNLTVPASAVIRDGVERYVLVQEGPGQYARQNVVVGRQVDGVVEIQRGSLVPGDRLVTVGSHELASLLTSGVLRPSPEAEKNIGLRVEPAGRQRVASTVTLSGSVDLTPDRKAVVSARLPGTVVRIHVDRSQAVAAGQVVAEVASVELQNLQLELLRQHLQVELLRGQLQRLQTLTPNPRKFRETESAANGARQRCESLQRKLETVGLSPEQVNQLVERKQLVEALPIRAPIAGAVVRFAAKLGQFVKAEDSLFEIHDLSQPLIQGHVAERDIRYVRVGQRARIRLTGDPNFQAEGTVVRSGQVVGDADRTLSVWVALTQPPAQTLLYGMMARVTLLEAESEPVLAVRREAILREGSRTHVFVRQADGSFVRRRVETGRSDDRWIEITHGLNTGEPVAVQGVAELQTGYASLK